MRRWVRALPVGVAIVAFGSLRANEAAATSCAPIEIDAATLVAGAPLFDGSPNTLYTSSDLVITGTVTDVVTDDVGGSATYGATETTFTVIGALGVDEIEATLVVWSPDPGWMNGYPFEVGRTYLVPLRSPGMLGHPFESFVCDAIKDITVRDAVDVLAAAPIDVRTATPAQPSPDTTQPSTETVPASTASASTVPASTVPATGTVPTSAPPVSDATPTTGSVVSAVDASDTTDDGVPSWAVGVGIGGLGVAAVLGLRGLRPAHAQR